MKKLKIKLKNEQGITLVALIVTVVILSILTVTVTTGVTSSMQTRNYNKFKEDINNLTEAVSLYYQKYETLPTTIRYNITENPIPDTDTNPNDSDTYYIVQASWFTGNYEYFNNITLNYGKGGDTSTDVYIVNSTSLTVYYANGLNYNGVMYYTLGEYDEYKDSKYEPIVNITASPVDWTTGTIRVIVKANYQGIYTLQSQQSSSTTVNESNWIDNKSNQNSNITTSQDTHQYLISENGTTIFARIIDENGNQVGNIVSKTISNIAPNISFNANGTSTYVKSVSTQVIVGGDVSNTYNTMKAKWVKGSTKLVNLSDFYDGFTFTNGQSFTNKDTTGDYYLWIYVGDESNNYVISGSNAFLLDNEIPYITDLVARSTSIKIRAIDNTSTIVGYTLTTNTTKPTNFTSCTGTNLLNTTVEGLTSNKVYYAWVIDQAGNISNYVQTKTEYSNASIYPANSTYTNVIEYGPNFNSDIITLAGSASKIKHIAFSSTAPASTVTKKDVSAGTYKFTKTTTIYGTKRFARVDTYQGPLQGDGTFINRYEIFYNISYSDGSTATDHDTGYGYTFTAPADSTVSKTTTTTINATSAYWNGQVSTTKTSDSYTNPDGSTGGAIYAWFDSTDGTIYLYSSNNADIAFSTNETSMFANLTSIESIDLTGIYCGWMSINTSTIAGTSSLKSITLPATWKFYNTKSSGFSAGGSFPSGEEGYWHMDDEKTDIKTNIGYMSILDIAKLTKAEALAIGISTSVWNQSQIIGTNFLSEEKNTSITGFESKFNANQSSYAGRWVTGKIK